MPPSPVNPHDALEFLASDYKAILAMFRDYERTSGDLAKGKEALRLCHRVSIHDVVKESIFYRAAAALGDKTEEVLANARSELGAIRGLIDKIEQTPAADSSFDPTMKALSEAVRQHFADEEKDLLPKLRHAGFDRAGIGEKLAAKQAELSTKPATSASIREARRVLGG